MRFEICDTFSGSSIDRIALVLCIHHQSIVTFEGIIFYRERVIESN